jgi:hypothetical protein
MNFGESGIIEFQRPLGETPIVRLHEVIFEIMNREPTKRWTLQELTEQVNGRKVSILHVCNLS